VSGDLPPQENREAYRMTEAAGEPPTSKSNAVAVARYLLRPSVLILVAANLVPLIGVIAWAGTPSCC
jgi:hypothetical protein